MRVLFVVVSLAVLVLLGLYTSVFVVSEGTLAIVSRFGRPVSIVKEPGLYFKLPTDTVTVLDGRVSILETEPTQVLLEDKKPLIVSAYAAWRISDPLLFYQSVGSEMNARQKLEDIVTSALGLVLTRYPTTRIFNPGEKAVALEECEARLLESVRGDAADKYGIEVMRVGITRLAYPQVVIRSVYERMKSERLKEAEKLKAEGEERAGRIRAEADKKARIIEAEARRRALAMEGEADRKAMETYAAAYAKAPDFFRFMRSLEAYEKILGKDDVVILSTDSPPFRVLFGGGEER